MLDRTTRAILPRLLAIAALAAVAFSSRTSLADEPLTRDVVVYGGTSAGVAAAVQASRMGRSVVLIEPGRHLGGLTAGGLGATDIGNKAAIGGISREFYRRVKAHYDRPEAWRVQKRSEYRSRRERAGDDAMWTFEPHVAEDIFESMVREAGVTVVREARLDLAGGVEKEGTELTAIRTETGETFRGRVFIDATYEGDLLAAAGVSYHVGRESNEVFGETLNGVQTRNAVYHQFRLPVDPYVVPGDPSSGLLPEIHGDPPGEDGTGDRRVQAYNFRMCLTDAPENRLPVRQPEGYDASRYELLLRYFDAGFEEIPWHLTPMPNRKTDINNNHAFSTDFIGGSYRYPEAGHEERERIVAEHRAYQEGLLWCLGNEPRVPEDVREEVSRWGFCEDEFTDNGGWPHQLYVREARRMVGEYVMTQHHCQRREVAPRPVGLAAYTMDSHNVQRYVAEGEARNEGDVQVGGFPPYPIDYGALCPRRDECTNLLVPVCVSSSHIAFGSIRMEPVFLVLGQSAATAASHAIEEGKAVQEIDVDRLRERLLADEQVLEWRTPPRPGVVEADELEGIVVDDADARLRGAWTSSTSCIPYIGIGYLHDGDRKSPPCSARFVPMIPEAGRYRVRIAWSPHPNRAPRVPVTVRSAEGEKTVFVDQRRGPTAEEPFVELGTWTFAEGTEGAVTISNAGTSGYVVVDAVQLIPVE